MSYVALATAKFDEVVQFYAEALGFPTLAIWDRPSGRGRVFDLQGLRLEILDATRESVPLRLEAAGDRFQLVIEVEDVEAARQTLAIPAPEAMTTTWGARVFRLRDPDGVSVWFLQWLGDATCTNPADALVRR